MQSIIISKIIPSDEGKILVWNNGKSMWQQVFVDPMKQLRYERKEKLQKLSNV
jgi:hypothetical protein